MSSKQLAKRLASTPEQIESMVRNVKRWRSGTTKSLRKENAAALEKALGTRGVFTAFIQKETTSVTRQSLEAQIADLRQRLAKLERTNLREIQ